MKNGDGLVKEYYSKISLIVVKERYTPTDVISIV